MLVGNKSDLKAERTVTSEEAQSFANEYELKYIETSAKYDDNIQECFLQAGTDLIAKLTSGEIVITSAQSSCGASLVENDEEEYNQSYVCC
jgi:GTPase SAR1 family protein